MTKNPMHLAPFPSRDDILKFIEDSPGRVGKREIGRAFHLNADQKLRLKKVLKELKDDGLLGPGRTLITPGSLPPVAVVVVTGIDTDGEVLARPQTWDEKIDPPAIYMAPEKRGQPALAAQDRVLARLTPAADNTYEGRTIRRISGAPPKVLGVYMLVDGQGRLRPTDRKAKGDFIVTKADSHDAQSGDLVRAEVLPGRRLGLRQARILERLDKEGGTGSVSLIAIHDNDIPTEFSKETLEQAAAAGPAPLDTREDLRDLPLVTIDGADARDFDDAVFAQADSDSKNKGGWRLSVAIADVSWYVRPGDSLDRDAYLRGNSVYFPDRVVPMLPEELSNGWCSLKPDEERPCLVAHMRINSGGHLISHRFSRALMRSRARLTYDQVQAARDGTPDEMTAPLTETVIAPLYGAYEALTKARQERGVLELDLPERRVVVGVDGKVERVEMRERFDSHKLIEEFMIAANVAAAETLEQKRQPCMYRIHDEPSMDKMEALRQFLASLSIPLAKGQVVRAELFNRILSKVKDTPNAEMVNQIVLRSQAQAEYNPENIGHFGLALRRYCHFTSPIRRYADLLVHRAMVSGLGLGEGGLEKNHKDFTRMGEVLSGLERRAAGAERSAVDRFTASFLADKVGIVFSGRINGVTRFGLFVTLEDSGADGLVPIRTLPEDYYVHEEAHHILRGKRTKRTFQLGQVIDVMLMEADAISGSMVMEVFDKDRPPSSGRAASKNSTRHKTAANKSKSKSRSKAGRRKAQKPPTKNG